MSPLIEPDKSRRALAIQEWLISQIAELTEVPRSEIDVTKPFQYYGLNSAEAAMLSVDLEKWLQITVTPTIAWDYPTIEAAASYLSDQTPAEQS
jgi:acyl carrier protein